MLYIIRTKKNSKRHKLSKIGFILKLAIQINSIICVGIYKFLQITYLWISF